jgi:hypothetical protein
MLVSVPRKVADGAGVFELHVGVVEGQMREVGVYDQAFGMLQRAFDADLAIGAAVASEFIEVQGGHEKRIEVDIADGDFSVHGKGIGEAEGHATGKFAGAHRRT